MLFSLYKFLLAAKPIGHGRVRVVVVGGDNFEVIISEVDQTKSQRQLFWMCNIFFISHPKYSLGWNSTISIKIVCLSLTKFLFRGGISYFHLNDLLLPSAAYIRELFVSTMPIIYSCQ